MINIPEKDWKLLRSLKDAKLDQACKEILNRVQNQIKDKGSEYHKKYLAVWEIVNTGNDEIAAMFDDLKRSNAILKLVSWKRNGLLTEEEFNKFSQETRSSIDAIANLVR